MSDKALILPASHGVLAGRDDHANQWLCSGVMEGHRLRLGEASERQHERGRLEETIYTEPPREMSRERETAAIGFMNYASARAAPPEG
ncbi:hypothetical protein PQR75_18540 [Paraburkholderia fungorum]|uniref:hypothetical protein n=1 Tax=Paraburkholderia fungorum TaxID=134537 RepID=UPI0038BBCF7D